MIVSRIPAAGVRNCYGRFACVGHPPAAGHKTRVLNPAFFYFYFFCGIGDPPVRDWVPAYWGPVSIGALYPYSMGPISDGSIIGISGPMI